MQKAPESWPPRKTTSRGPSHIQPACLVASGGVQGTVCMTVYFDSAKSSRFHPLSPTTAKRQSFRETESEAQEGEGCCSKITQLTAEPRMLSFKPILFPLYNAAWKKCLCPQKFNFRSICLKSTGL